MKLLMHIIQSLPQGGDFIAQAALARQDGSQQNYAHANDGPKVRVHDQ